MQCYRDLVTINIWITTGVDTLTYIPTRQTGYYLPARYFLLEIRQVQYIIYYIHR